MKKNLIFALSATVILQMHPMQEPLKVLYKKAGAKPKFYNVRFEQAVNDASQDTQLIAALKEYSDLRGASRPSFIWSTEYSKELSDVETINNLISLASSCNI